MRKASGGKYKKARKKKKYERKIQQRFVRLGEERKKKIRTRGGNIKVVLLSANFANVVDKEGKARKVKIKAVLDGNKRLARLGIMTKGSIIETEIGKAKITNRPSQEGTINAVLL